MAARFRKAAFQMFKKSTGGLSAPDQQYIAALNDVSFHPIYIVGDHRTGTTILYEILQSTQSFNIVTAYHIIRYDEILHDYFNTTTDTSKTQLANLLVKRGLRDRGIDGVLASPETPEEYGFILRGERYRPRLKPQNLASFVELCKKIQLTSDPARPILLKNPWDCLNFMYLKEAFPDSKFIFIHRNPIHTINSQLKSTRSLLANQNEYVSLVARWYEDIFQQPLRLRVARFLFSEHFDIGLRIVTRHVRLATSYFLNHIGSLPRRDYICLRYEDLCSEPTKRVAGILEFLGLQANAYVEYEALVNPRPISLLREVERKRNAIFKELRPYFEYWGYQP